MFIIYDKVLNARFMKRAPGETFNSRFQTLKFYDIFLDVILLHSKRFRSRIAFRESWCSAKRNYFHVGLSDSSTTVLQYWSTWFPLQ